MPDAPTKPTQNNLFLNVQVVDPKAPMTWIKKGWEDLKRNKFASLFYGLCFSLGGLLLVFVLGGAAQYIAFLSSGFLLVGPFLAIGLYELSRQTEKNLSPSLISTLTAWRPNAGQLFIFSCILLAVYLIWGLTVLVLFNYYFPGEIPEYGELLQLLVLTEDISFLIVCWLIGTIFALICFTISLVTIPMMMDRNTDAISAMLSSVVAVFRNPEAMILWSGLIATLAILGLITFFLGLLVIGPLLGHATWHAYRSLIKPE